MLAEGEAHRGRPLAAALQRYVARHGRTDSPEGRLWVAVLQLALSDLVAGDERRRLSALRWFRTRDAAIVCAFADIDLEALVEALVELGVLTPPRMDGGLTSRQPNGGVRLQSVAL